MHLAPRYVLHPLLQSLDPPLEKDGANLSTILKDICAKLGASQLQLIFQVRNPTVILSEDEKFE